MKMDVAGLRDQECRGGEVEKEVINFSGQESWRWKMQQWIELMETRKIASSPHA